jgi:DNA polymerase IV
MGAAKARRLCPQAVVADARWSAYVDASKVVFEVFHDTAPLVEKLSIERGVPGRRRTRTDLRLA